MSCSDLILIIVARTVKYQLFLVDERFYDVHLIIWPAGSHTSHQTRHVINIFLNSGPHFRFSVKPGAGSLALEIESIVGVKSPVGLIGQFMNAGSYTLDAAGNIQTT